MTPLARCILAAALIAGTKTGQAQLLAKPPMPVSRSAASGSENDPNNRPRPVVAATDHCLLGDVYWGEGKFALAAEAYETADRLGLDSLEIHLKLARAYLHLNNATGPTEARTVHNGTPGRIKEDVYLIEPMPNEPGRFLVAPKSSAVYQLQLALDGGLDGPRVRWRLTSGSGPAVTERPWRSTRRSRASCPLIGRAATSGASPRPAWPPTTLRGTWTG